MLGLPKKRKHVRTVSRFCDEANIGEEDELDLAEFILAAQYLGSEAKDDQLMETFMEMEDNNDLTNQTPQEIIRNVLKKVEQKYDVKEHMLKSSDELEDEEDENDLNDEIEKTRSLDPFTEDLNWQNDRIGEMLNTSVESSNISIARNLLENTALTAKQISDLTGLPLSKVEEIEEEFEDLSDEEEDERPLKKSEIKKQQEQQKLETKIVDSENFNRILGVTKNGLQSIDKILSTGKQTLNDQADSVLELLKKFKLALANQEGDSKGFKKMRTELLSVQFTEKDKKKLTKDIKKVETEKMNQTFLNVSNSKNTNSNNQTSNTISINIGSTKPKSEYPQLWRVVIHPGALAKKEEDIKSPVAGKVEIGTVVRVEELKGRRARISKPINGWLSITSSQGKVILEKEGTKSKLMANAKAKERARQTKILILKSVTTLNEKTVERILIKSEWNLRRAIEAFYIAKFKTQEYMKAKEQNKKKQQNTNNTSSPKTTSSPKNEKQDTKTKKEKGWFSSWKTFIKS